MRKLIEESTGALSNALARGDGAGAAALYTDDARLLPPGAELLHGREEIERFWCTGIEIGIAAIELEPLAYEGSAGLAYQLGRYRLRLEPAEDAPVSERGKYIAIHKRQADGSWKLAVEFFASDSPNERSQS